MPADVSRPTLGVFANGLAEFESLFPVASALQADGRVRPLFFASRHMRRLEPRLPGLLADAGIQARFAFRPVLKHLFEPFLRPLDAAMVLTDPAIDVSGRARRARAMMDRDLPTVLLQHGVIQEGLNRLAAGVEPRFYSQLVLTFEDVSCAPEPVAGALKDRARTVGFVKRPPLPPAPPTRAFRAWRAGFDRVVLLCHSFRWAERYSERQVAQFYQMASDAAAASPGAGFVIRPHRGLPDPAHDAFDAAIEQDRANVVVSRHKNGPMAGCSMHDLLAAADAVVSTASTAILDAAYAGRTVAVYANDSDKFQDLADIRSAADLTAFLAAPEGAIAARDALLRRYGDFEGNLARAVEAVADFMASRRETG